MMTGIPLPFLFGVCLVVKKHRWWWWWWWWNRKKTNISFYPLFLSDFFIPLLVFSQSFAQLNVLGPWESLWQVKNQIIWLIRLKMVFVVWNIKHKKSNFHTVWTANSIDQIWKKKKKILCAVWTKPLFL